MQILWSIIAFTLAIAGSVASEAVKPFVPTSSYVTTNVAGWAIRVNKRLLDSDRTLGSNALQLLERKLLEVKSSVPTNACQKLQKVTIWLGIDDGHAPCSEYHPSKQWLIENGYNSDKARCVEIGNARRFIDWSRSQPSMVLHELAHAYHDQVLGNDYRPIKQAYANARQNKSYEAVKRVNGRTERAYAMTDPQEYFAEATEAFFGQNDFYPFNRAELKEHDPDFYNVVEDCWKR